MWILPKARKAGYPLEYTLFEEQYPELTDEMIEKAMQVMDEGYLAQGYYRNLKAKIRLEGDRKETFTYDNYSVDRAYLTQTGVVAEIFARHPGVFKSLWIQHAPEQEN